MRKVFPGLLCCLLFGLAFQASSQETVGTTFRSRGMNYRTNPTLTEKDARDISEAVGLAVIDYEVPGGYPGEFKLLCDLMSAKPGSFILFYGNQLETWSAEWVYQYRPKQKYLRDLAEKYPKELYLLDTEGRRIVWWPEMELMNVTSMNKWLVGGKDWLGHYVTFLDTAVFTDDLPPVVRGFLGDNAWEDIGWIEKERPGFKFDANSDGQPDLAPDLPPNFNPLDSAMQDRMNRYVADCKKFGLFVGNELHHYYEESGKDGAMCEDFPRGSFRSPYQATLLYLSLPQTGRFSILETTIPANYGVTIGAALMGEGYYGLGQDTVVFLPDIELGLPLEPAQSLVDSAQLATIFAPAMYRRYEKTTVALNTSVSDNRALALPEGSYDLPPWSVTIIDRQGKILFRRDAQRVR